MKIVQINAVYGQGSTGKICKAVSKLLDDKQIENYVLCSYGTTKADNVIKCASRKYIKIQACKSHIFGNYGFNSHIATKRIIKEIKKINPDIIHLHNIHGHDCHLKYLFSFLKKRRTKLFWTFHDCWAFTGYCPNYDMVNCNQWKQECCNCPQKKAFSVLIDNSTSLQRRKKILFDGLDLNIIVPSEWMARQVRESFLKEYPIKVINNGINLSIFAPSIEEKDTKENKKVVLGVAYNWDERKGLDVFLKLCSDLDESYQIVLVGTNVKIDKKLPERIISIHRTKDQKELARLYSIADVFVNPTREENFPTTNIESLACGTPVITFNTGGSAEMLTNETGIIVEKNDYIALYEAIRFVCEKKPFSREACRKQAENFNCEKVYEEYVKLYMR